MKNDNQSEFRNKIKDLEKQIEELQRMNFLYKNIIHSLPFGIKAFDKNGFLCEVNPKQKELIGLPDLERGIGTFNILTDTRSIHTGANKKYAKVYKGECYEDEFEYDFEGAIGSWSNHESKKVFRESIFPIKSEYGQIEYVVDLLQDKTSEVRAQQKLKEKEIKFRALYENAPLAYQSLDENGNIKDVNPAWLNTLGYEKEEVVGRSFAEFLHPEWKPHFEKNFPEFKRRGVIHNVHFRLQHKENYYLDVYFEGCIGYNPDGSFQQTYCVFKDVTKEMQREIQLNESEERFRAIFKQDQSVKLLINPKTQNIEDANPAAAHFYGYSLSRLKDIKINEINQLPPDELRKEINDAVKRNKNYFNFKHKLANGEIRDVEVYSSPIRYGDDTKLLSFIHDITEQKKNREALDKSEKKYRTIVENINDAMFIHDFDGIINFVNDHACQMLGYSKEELKGASLKMIHTPDNIDNISKLIQERKWDNQILFEDELQKKDGTKIPVEISTRKVSELNNGEIQAFVRDITVRKAAENALKESEEKFRSFVNNSSDAVRLSDENGKIIFVNNSHEKLTGYNESEVIGESIWDFNYKMFPDEQKTQKRYNRLKRKLQSAINGETRYLFNKPYVVTAQTKHGNIVKLQEAAFKIHTSKGFLFGATIRDITKLKQQEEKLRDLNATKDKFFSIISHDLRNPFQSILGFSQLAMESAKKNDFSRIEKYTSQIHKSAQLSYNLLNNLLEWSRIQRGKIDYVPDELSLKPIVDKTVNLLKVNMDEKNIQLSYSINPDITVYVDRLMLETIIRNLLSNAIKYTPNGGLIKLEAISTDEGVNISVRDSGVGINPDDMNKLFVVGSNYSTPGTNKEEGTGLGLILCKEFVDKHGGTIWVESEEEKGSVFTFTLPA